MKKKEREDWFFASIINRSDEAAQINWITVAPQKSVYFSNLFQKQCISAGLLIQFKIVLQEILCNISKTKQN